MTCVVVDLYRKHNSAAEKVIRHTDKRPKCTVKPHPLKPLGDKEMTWNYQKV